ncbi:MAG: hypothetical protein ABSF28_15220 [Terracidiphilus sp.]
MKRRSSGWHETVAGAPPEYVRPYQAIASKAATDTCSVINLGVPNSNRVVAALSKMMD